MKKLLSLFFVLTSFLWASNAQAQYGDRHVNDPTVLAVLRNANFNVTTDQIISLPFGVAKYYITSIYATNCSTSMTTAAGGIYTAVTKGGTAVVAAGQTYATLTTSTVLLSLTIAATTTAWTANPIYLSLTIGQGSASTCDIYVVGYNLS